MAEGTPKKRFSLQWHLTNDCDRECGHCYIPEEEREPVDPLTTQEAFEVVDKLEAFIDRWDMFGRIIATGGNPLFRKDLFEILGYSASKGNMTNHVLGNPYPLTEENLRGLRETKVITYQLSLDGLKATHDSIRGEGSFDQTLEGITILKEAGMRVPIMTTVSSVNIDEIPELVRVAIAAGADHLDFARFVPHGRGEDFEYEPISPQRFRRFLEEMRGTYQELIDKGVARPEQFGTKDPLWVPYLAEIGEMEIDPDMKLYTGGCGLGRNGLSIDVDGSVYACRRMPEAIGNIRDSTIYDLFIRSAELNALRDFTKVEGCGDCDVLYYCRGCRAVAWGENGDYFSKDPQCWVET